MVSDSDKRFLLKEYQDRGPQACADHLGMPVSTITSAAHRLGLSQVRQTPDRQYWDSHRNYKAYSDGELDYMHTHYSQLGPTEISRDLGRSTSSVKNKANELGLRFVKALTDEEVNCFNGVIMSGTGFKKAWTERFQGRAYQDEHYNYSRMYNRYKRFKKKTLAENA